MKRAFFLILLLLLLDPMSASKAPSKATTLSHRGGEPTTTTTETTRNRWQLFSRAKPDSLKAAAAQIKVAIMFVTGVYAMALLYNDNFKRLHPVKAQEPFSQEDRILEVFYGAIIMLVWGIILEVFLT